MNLNIVTNEDLERVLAKLDSIAQQVESFSAGIKKKPLYTIDEACEVLHVSKRTLQKYRDEGLIEGGPYESTRSE